MVDGWRALADQSRWDEFVAAMLQEHYDVVYARAQVKYLTPSSSPGDTDPLASDSATSPDLADTSSDVDDTQYDGATQQSKFRHEVTAVDGQDNHSEDVKAAAALSHLFGGPRQKLMQQMSTKQAESTLRWHREPVEDISDTIYSALAVKLLSQYDPAALGSHVAHRP